MKPFLLEDLRIGVVGLGYVGLPLAVEFGHIFPVVGYDLNSKRINLLKIGHDETLEVSKEELQLARLLTFSSRVDDLKDCNCYIIAVPTPIDSFKRPDLTALFNASKIVGQALKVGDIVIYESTVYPGCTEDDCVPVLEKYSGLKFNESFYCGYSPERINPGDKEHRLTSIKKVTAGSTPYVADFVDSIYCKIISAGTHKANSIRIAEAAKVIENTQRDLNIALINELAMIFNKMGIDTEEVLNAAGSKWNFLPFRPGLVGGHCIGVDPYYLTHKAQSIGYNPEIILAGRRVNDGMGNYVARELVKMMAKKRISISGAKVLLMGFTFKENCPDLRNTRVVDILNELRDFDCSVDIYDPWVDKRDAHIEHGVLPIDSPQNGTYDAVILAVSHKMFKDMGIDKIRGLGKQHMILYDLKYIFRPQDSDLRL